MITGHSHKAFPDKIETLMNALQNGAPTDASQCTGGVTQAELDEARQRLNPN